ncbi:MAG: glutamyl-tRNA reductase [Acidimicrobiales bacterium]|nr:glutamyl-tRNA reductase [Acidimicrobiales bacterium]RZV46658.1 MAG: glutamyl-tRNA reductase [Acidimicrobiales bacterium]
MSVVVVGVNHRSVPLDVLERMAVADEQLPKLLGDLTGSPDVTEAVVLSTCNRTEIYARVERFHPAYADVRDSLARHSELGLDQFSEHLYVHHDEDAARHLFSVTCGIDSAVLGESEILGQVRRAFDRAREEGFVATTLSDLFAASFKAGKRVRSTTGIAKNVTSVSRAAVAMATERLGSLEGRTICVLGAGEMSEGMTVALRDAGTREIFICNRTTSRAAELAERVGGVAVALQDLPDLLADVDVLLTGTGANSLMVSQEQLASVMADRTDRQLLIVDIAVPRDVDPAAADVPGVTLLDMDDLAKFAEAGKAERRNEIAAVRDVIDTEVDRFRATSLSRQVEPLLAEFRRDVESLRATEINRLAPQLDSETAAHVDAATRAVLNKLLHSPMSELRGAAGTARGERLAEALRELFDITADE